MIYRCGIIEESLEKGQPIPVYVYPATASGGLFSTVDDIARFVAAGMTRFGNTGHAVLSPETIAELYVPGVDTASFYSIVFDAYGYGHFIENLSNGYRAVAHGGQGYGWMTHFHAVPETGDGIVILINSQRSWPFFVYVLSDWARWIGAGSVGMGKRYTKQDVLRLLPQSDGTEYQATGFEARQIGSDVVLLTYRTAVRDRHTGRTTWTLRSSLWRRRDDGWQLVFHQGTPEAGKT